MVVRAAPLVIASSVRRAKSFRVGNRASCALTNSSSLTSHPECDRSATLPATRALAPSEVRTRLAAGGRWIRTIGTPQSFLAVPSIPPIHLPKYYADCIKGTKGLRYIYDKRNKIQMERHLEKYGDWVVSEFGEDGRRSRLITAVRF